jgi:hypothetical protein
MGYSIISHIEAYKDILSKYHKQTNNMKFIVECLSKECLDVFFNTQNTTTTICAKDRHDGQILAIALVAAIGPLAIAGFVRHCALMSVEAQDRYRRWREDELTTEKV